MQKHKFFQDLIAQTVFLFLFLIIARSKNSIVMTKRDLPNEVLVGLLMNMK